jgi:sialate O-acetylesterase
MSNLNFKNMKRNLYHLLLCLAVTLLFTCYIHAEVKLPAIFGDHMVLQQQTEAAIWGKAPAGKTVKVITSWDKKSYTSGVDTEGNWKVRVKTPDAGGPYTISVSDGQPLLLKNVMIGEVWICSGQSNMQMTMRGYRNQPVTGSNEAITGSANPLIRLFTVERKANLMPMEDFTGKWLECQPENVADFSATAWFFGQLVHKALGVPVGLIVSSWGGTRIEPWISEATIKEFDFIKLPDKNQTGTLSQQTPTVLFNAMIHPMVGYAFRGALWYQGESNRNEPGNYEKMMPGLVKSWRTAWGAGDFPFYYVQIAPYDYGSTGLSSAFLREAQLKASSVLPNMGMACLLDAGEKDCIHPANKKAAGERLAFLALAKTYGKGGFEYSGPVLKEMKVEGSLVYLTFDHAQNGLTTFGKELVNFKVAGENKVFVAAKAAITNAGITLFAPSVGKPVAVRYAFDDFVIGELFNTEGLPASSFRTDSWEK